MHNLTVNDHKTASVLSGEPNFKGSENFAKSFPEAMVKSYETVDGRTKVTFTWNGEVVGSCAMVKPPTKRSNVKVGFSSHKTQFSIKDVYVEER